MNLDTLIDQFIGEEKETLPYTDLKNEFPEGYNQALQDLKSRKQELVEGIRKQIVEHQFKMDIKDYLPKVKSWTGGYDKPFDDGYEQARLDLLKQLTGE